MFSYVCLVGSHVKRQSWRSKCNHLAVITFARIEFHVPFVKGILMPRYLSFVMHLQCCFLWGNSRRLKIGPSKSAPPPLSLGVVEGKETSLYRETTLFSVKKFWVFFLNCNRRESAFKIMRLKSEKNVAQRSEWFKKFSSRPWKLFKLHNSGLISLTWLINRRVSLLTLSLTGFAQYVLQLKIDYEDEPTKTDL